MITKQHLSPQAFIFSAFPSFDISGEEEALCAKFYEAYKERIQEMFDQFLMTEAMKNLLTLHPILKKKIVDTPLSSRAKNVLMAYDVNRIIDLVQFSPDELRRMKNMGAGTVKEIEDFVAGLCA